MLLVRRSAGDFASSFGGLTGWRFPVLVRLLWVLQLLGDLVGVGELGVSRQLLQALQDTLGGAAAPGGGE